MPPQDKFTNYINNQRPKTHLVKNEVDSNESDMNIADFDEMMDQKSYDNSRVVPKATVKDTNNDNDSDPGFFSDECDER